MPSAQSKRTISLPSEHSNYIDKQVASGKYASASEVVRAGLRALQERDEVIEEWILREVVPAYENYKANPESAVGIDVVLKEMDRIISGENGGV